MPLLLYRYILSHLIRVLVLTLVVLVTVVAFGATIKPLAADVLLGAGQTAKYMLLVTVPMLQFALPFSAGFAATLTMHRLTSDNEILAAAVGGISHRRLLLPVAALGIVLMLGMVLLTQWIIPRFWEQLERAVARDVTRLFQASLDRGEPFKLGDLQIYADRLRVYAEPEATSADTRLRLWGVAAAELDDEGRIATDVTAAQAVIDIYRRADATILKLVLWDTVLLKDQAGTLAHWPKVEPRAIPVPRVFEDEPRAMTRAQLLHLRENPDEFGPIARARRRLAESIREIDLRRWIDQRLRQNGEIRFDETADDARRYIVRADRLRGCSFVTNDDRPVQVEQHVSGVAIWLADAEEVEVDYSEGSALGGETLEIALEEVRVTDLRRTAAPNRRLRLYLPRLLLAQMPPGDPRAESSAALLDRFRAVEDPDDGLTERADKLRREQAGLQWQITSRLWKRYALSITALLLLLLGATLAMWLRESLPLTIYLWSFVPAVLDLIVISGGEQMARHGQTLYGLTVMWSGNAVLLLFLLATYWKLARH